MKPESSQKEILGETINRHVRKREAFRYIEDNGATPPTVQRATVVFGEERHLTTLSYSTNAGLATSALPGLHFFFAPTILHQHTSPILTLAAANTPCDSLRSHHYIPSWCCPSHGPFGCSCVLFCLLVFNLEKLLEEVECQDMGWTVVGSDELSTCTPHFRVNKNDRSWCFYLVGLPLPEKIVGPFSFTTCEVCLDGIELSWMKSLAAFSSRLEGAACVRCRLSAADQCSRCKVFLCRRCSIHCHSCFSLVCHACGYELAEEGPVCLWCVRG